MRRRGIALQLGVLILGGSAVVLALIVAYNYTTARRIIVRQAEENAGNLVANTVGRVETVLRAAEKVPEGLAQVLAESSYPEAQLLEVLGKTVERNREVYGLTVAYEPYGARADAEYFAPYYYKSDGKLRFKFLGGESYRYFFMDWYQIPRHTGRSIWTEPYFDEGGGQVVMSTYAVPFYRTVEGQPRFAGVIAANVSLDWLETITSSMQLLSSGYAFLVSHNGMIVTHPDARLVMNESIFSLAETRRDAGLRALGRAMVQGETGMARTECLDGSDTCWLAFAPMPANGWAVAAMLPESEVMADVVALNRTMVLIGGVGSLLLVLVVVGALRSLSRPIWALAQASEEIARGNFDAAVPRVDSPREVAQLADAFAGMQRELKRYIRDLEESSAARERATEEAARLALERQALQRELDIAAGIQQSILPRTFPPFPERTDLDVFAAMIPAREVGGDFYDFFLVDRRRLGFVVGDVSGKGVPAAIFMALSRTLLKATALHGLPPGECLSRVNRLLCRENGSEMFVTVFYGILDAENGILEYANAGHPAPLLLRRSGEVERLPRTGGIALGALEGAEYLARRSRVQQGDTVFVFSDGVTESMTTDGRFFGEERLESALARFAGAPAAEMVEGVVAAVREFAGAQPPHDDLAVLAVRSAQPRQRSSTEEISARTRCSSATPSSPGRRSIGSPM